MTRLPAEPTPEALAELSKRLRRYPEIREHAWELFDQGFCYDDQTDNGPIQHLAIEAAEAIDALSSITPEALGKQLLAQGFGNYTSALRKAFDAILTPATEEQR